MLYLQTFCCISVSISCTRKYSWRTLFRRSYRLQISVGLCPSLVSSDTPTSGGLRNQSCLSSRENQAASSLQASYVLEIVRTYETYTKNQADEATRDLLVEITKACEICQRSMLVVNALESRYGHLILVSTVKWHSTLCG